MVHQNFKMYISRHLPETTGTDNIGIYNNTDLSLDIRKYYNVVTILGINHVDLMNNKMTYY